MRRAWLERRKPERQPVAGGRAGDEHWHEQPGGEPDVLKRPLPEQSLVRGVLREIGRRGTDTLRGGSDFSESAAGITTIYRSGKATSGAPPGERVRPQHSKLPV